MGTCYSVGLDSRFLRALTVILVLSLLFACSCLSTVARAASACSFELNLKFPGVKKLRGPFGKYLLQMKGYPASNVPGHPRVPTRVLTVAAPPGMRVVGVEVVKVRWKPVSQKINLEIGEHAIPSGKPVGRKKQPVPAFNRDSFYPSEEAVLDGTGMMRSLPVAAVRVNPVRFKASAGKVEACAEMRLKVLCIPAEDIRQDAYSLRDAFEKLSDSEASSIIFNIEQAREWYEEALKSKAREHPLSVEPDAADYLIIAPDSLISATAPLMDRRREQGMSVRAVSLEWIKMNVPGWDMAEKIRCFLTERYLEWGIEYVLLVGSDRVIPMGRAYTPFSFHVWSWDYIPTDYYYCDLTGDWDLNGDGKYGQFLIDDSPGGVDFYPEVYVGRIPFDTSGEVLSVCQKIVDYENDSGGWKNRALVMGAVTNYQNEPFLFLPATYNSGYGEVLKRGVFEPQGIEAVTMYEKEGLAPDPVPCVRPLNFENVLSAWQEGFGFVTWACHGASSYVVREVWERDNGDGLPQPAEISWPRFFSSYHAQFLNDSMPSIVFGAACYTASPTSESSLMAELLKSGACATVGSTEVTLGELAWDEKDDGGMQSIGYYFFDFLLNGKQRVGEALRLSLVHYRNNYCWYPILGYINLYEYNLYGDPAMWIYRQDSLPVLEGISPDSGGPGCVVRLIGSNFGDERCNSRVLFNQVEAADYLSWSNTEITVKVPPGLSGLVNVCVVTGKGASLKKPFSAVSIAAIEPGTADSGSVFSIHTVSGSGFLPRAQVLFIGSSGHIQAGFVHVSSPETLSCIINLSGAPPGDYDLLVRNFDGSSARLSGCFKVTACGAGSAASLLFLGGFLGLLGLATMLRAGLRV